MESTNSESAIKNAEEGLFLARHLNNKKAEVDLLTSLGRIHLLKGDFYDSLKNLSIALQVATECEELRNDAERLAFIHNYYGVVYHDKNNLEVALYHFTEVLKHDVKSLNVRAYNNLGSLHINAGQFDKAMEFLKKGEEESIELGEYFCRVYIYENIARIHQLNQEFERSNEYYFQAQEIIVQHQVEGSNYIHATILNRLGRNFMTLGNLSKSQDMLERSLEETSRHQFIPMQCECLCDLGNLHKKKGNIQLFLDLHQQCLSISREKQLFNEQINCLTNLRDFYIEQGDTQQAYEYCLQIDELRKLKIKELERSNLAHILGQREFEIFQLKEKNQKILRQNQELEQFARIVAHDLKEPLRNINSYATLLVRRYQDQLDDDADEFIGFISGNVVRMNALLSDLLQYTSLEKAEIAKKDIPLEAIVENVKFALSEKIKMTQTQIKVGILPTVYVNNLHMELLFQNLMQNAIKFRKEEVPCVIEIGASETDDYFEIQVKDNGIGIPEEYYSRIFQIFKRLDRLNYEGTGMGLAICEKIINHYGGNIWVNSEEGEGSSFHFTIPKTK